MDRAVRKPFKIQTDKGYLFVEAEPKATSDSMSPKTIKEMQEHLLDEEVMVSKPEVASLVDREHVIPCLNSLQAAVKFGDVAMFTKVALDIKKSNEHYEPDLRGWTPLHTCIALEKDNFSAMLLRHEKESHNLQDVDGISPLHLAAIHRNKEIISRLSELNCEMNPQTEDGTTPVHIAARMGDNDSLHRLVAGKADVNQQSKNGWTAMHYAAVHGQMKTLSLLMRLGANPEIRNNIGMSPGDIGVCYGYDDTHMIIMLGQQYLRKEETQELERKRKAALKARRANR